MDVGGRQAGNGDQQRGSSAQQGLHPEQLLCGACGSGAKSPIVAGAGKPGNRQAVVTVGGPETYGTAGAVAVSGMPSETPDDPQAAMRRCALPSDRAPHPARSEERRVGKEWGRTCRSRGWPCQDKKKK